MLLMVRIESRETMLVIPFMMPGVVHTRESSASFFRTDTRALQGPRRLLNIVTDIIQSFSILSFS